MRMARSSISRKSDLQSRVVYVYEHLLSAYPDAHCTLENVHPHQFLLASILSPRCTDIVANRVSRDLWKAFGSAGAVASAPIGKIERIIRPCGMYRVKARNMQRSAELLVGQFEGTLPRTLNELRLFPGIGRKTSLLILLEVHGIVEGIIIDTHNIRIARRLELTQSRNPSTVENDLCRVVPKKYWAKWSHLMVYHGRSCCTARKPMCATCPILNACPFGKKNVS